MLLSLKLKIFPLLMEGRYPHVITKLQNSGFQRSGITSWQYLKTGADNTDGKPKLLISMEYEEEYSVLTKHRPSHFMKAFIYDFLLK